MEVAVFMRHDLSYMRAIISFIHSALGKTCLVVAVEGAWLQESPVLQHRTHEPDLVRLWLLRMLFQFGCLGQFVQKDDFDNSSVAYFLGLKEFVEEGNFDRKKYWKN